MSMEALLDLRHLELPHQLDGLSVGLLLHEDAAKDAEQGLTPQRGRGGDLVPRGRDTQPDRRLAELVPQLHQELLCLRVLSRDIDPVVELELSLLPVLRAQATEEGHIPLRQERRVDELGLAIEHAHVAVQPPARAVHGDLRVLVLLSGVHRAGVEGRFLRRGRLVTLVVGLVAVGQVVRIRGAEDGDQQALVLDLAIRGLELLQPLRAFHAGTDLRSLEGGSGRLLGGLIGCSLFFIHLCFLLLLLLFLLAIHSTFALLALLGLALGALLLPLALFGVAPAPLLGVHALRGGGAQQAGALHVDQELVLDSRQVHHAEEVEVEVIRPSLCLLLASLAVHLLELRECPQTRDHVGPAAEGPHGSFHLVTHLAAGGEGRSAGGDGDDGRGHLRDAEQGPEDHGTAQERLQREPSEHPADGQHRGRGAILDGVQHDQLGHRGLDSGDRGRVWGGRQELAGVAAQRDRLEGSVGQVAALHLGRRAPRHGGELLAAVQAVDLALAHAACAALALHGVGLADPDGIQEGHASLGVVRHLPVQARVDDDAHVVDRHGTLGDVRCQDHLDLTRFRRLENLLLLILRHRGVQLDHPQL
mmetsp:Transcript_21392/g.69200  ORF Transcript_21392/g.69200 Transcript_21392/m.69200 type:complete len:589 (+) Transcript_21392:359-2125(+)